MGVSKFHQLFLNSLKGPLADLLELRDEAAFSFALDQTPLQDSFLYRAKRLGLKIAHLILDEAGELKKEMLDHLDRLLAELPFILGPEREGDALIYRHLQNCLRHLKENQQIGVLLRKFSPPLCHKKCEELIRETLWPETIKSIESKHIRKAVLASWMTLLRQTTGSCFATAPAILIQRRDPVRFFKDLYDLLSTGQMKRVHAGHEYSVPLNLSSGGGDLQKMAAGSEHAAGLRMALHGTDTHISQQTIEKIKELGPMSAEYYIKAVLLHETGLTEEDVRDEEHLASLQLTPLLARTAAIYYQKPSPRAQKVSEWKKKCAKACLYFRLIAECPLLRAWEYSIASFSDVKTEFARWNLYIGLGLHPDQKQGVGAFLYEKIGNLLTQLQQEIERISQEYERQSSAIRALQTMIQGAGSQAQINRLKAELTSQTLSIDTLLELRNSSIAKADALAEFLPSLIRQYDEKLQDAFQELFDPSLAAEQEHLYEDSSAGFRLVYKHGRRDASQWTSIRTGEEYVDCLADFFSRVEGDLIMPPPLNPEFTSDITTGLIQRIREPSFLTSAIERAHEKGRKSPWDYVSGGTLQTLLAVYCGRARPFTESSLTPHSEKELLQFLLDRKGNRQILMHSPTHAFIFDPQLLSTVKWPQKLSPWNGPEQEYIAHRASEKLPLAARPLFIHLVRQKIPTHTNVQFRASLIEALPSEMKQKEAVVDSILYEFSPLLNQAKSADALSRILKALGFSHRPELWDSAFFGCLDLYRLAKMNILKFLGNAVVKEDWDQKIAGTIRQLGYSPHCILFADTNWSEWFFGFTLNPASGALELWRFNRTGTQGFPMYDWKQWLHPSNDSPWIFLSNPEEYLEISDAKHPQRLV